MSDRMVGNFEDLVIDGKPVVQRPPKASEATIEQAVAELKSAGLSELPTEDEIVRVAKVAFAAGKLSAETVASLRAEGVLD